MGISNAALMEKMVDEMFAPEFRSSPNAQTSINRFAKALALHGPSDEMVAAAIVEMGESPGDEIYPEQIFNVMLKALAEAKE